MMRKGILPRVELFRATQLESGHERGSVDRFYVERGRKQHEVCAGDGCWLFTNITCGPGYRAIVVGLLYNTMASSEYSGLHVRVAI